MEKIVYTQYYANYSIPKEINSLNPSKIRLH